MIRVIVYVSAIVAANLGAYYFGPSITPINSFVLIGLDLSLRDSLHEYWKGNGLTWKMGSLIFAGSAISYIANPASGQIAVASCLSFFCASWADHMTYTFAANRHFMVKSNGSNIVGAAVDSILFPTIAFGSVMPLIVASQFIAKVAGGLIWSAVIYKTQTKSAQEPPCATSSSFAP